MPGRVAVDRLVDVPFCLGQVLQQRFDLLGQRRRDDRLGQQPQPGAAAAAAASRMAARDGGQRVAPGARLAQVGDRLRAVRVVERQHRGLVEDVGAAAAGRMIGIALDLGGPALWLSTSNPTALPANVMVVAKNSGLPGTTPSGG